MLFSYCRLIIFKSFKIESGWILGYMIGFRVGQVLDHLISSCLRSQIVDIGSSQISCGLGLDRIWDPLILSCLRFQVILSRVRSNQVPINLTFRKKSGRIKFEFRRVERIFQIRIIFCQLYWLSTQI
jgi:hypothetical protein